MLRLSHTSFRLPVVVFAALFFVSFSYFPIFQRDREWNSVPSEDNQPSQIAHKVSSIPKKLWYKLGSKPLSDEPKKWLSSCTDLNPNYEITTLTDETASLYVSEHFSHRPDIISTYNALQIPILRADLIRYLLLYNSGGVYNDLDISCHLPIDNWIPEEFVTKANLVVGYEFDYGLFPLYIHPFTTWTVMAAPGSVHMMTVIDDLIEGVNQTATDHSVSISDLTMEMVGDVVDITGPRRMTRSINKSLKSKNFLGPSFDEKNHWEITKPLLLADVLIMPGWAMAASMNKYDGAPNKEDIGQELVRHHYAGSWKNDRGGEGL